MPCLNWLKAECKDLNAGCALKGQSEVSATCFSLQRLVHNFLPAGFIFAGAAFFFFLLHTDVMLHV